MKYIRNFKLKVRSSMPVCCYSLDRMTDISDKKFKLLIVHHKQLNRAFTGFGKIENCKTFNSH